MSIKELEKQRKNKLFRPWDVVLYALILFAVLLSFLIPILTRSSEEIEGVTLSYRSKIVATYSFTDGLKRYADTVEITLEEEDGARLKVKMPEGVNVLQIDLKNKTAVMVDSDCSARADCTLMRIEKSTDSIVCVPHGLVVTGFTSSFVPPDGILV